MHRKVELITKETVLQSSVYQTNDYLFCAYMLYITDANQAG